MSGILAICNFNDAPVSGKVAQDLLDCLKFRGPDDQRSVNLDNVFLGHTLFRTVEDCLAEEQPFTIDGQSWITADVRLDRRDELVDEIKKAGGHANLDFPDCRLILEAYGLWAEDCLAHLSGDFSFLIWDGARQTLFGARDHFGIRPFYYSHLADVFLASNTQRCLRRHPSVSQKINDQAVGDFLLFDFNQDLSTTMFADIQRLPPGHYLKLQRENLKIQRYWSLPENLRIEYSNPDDYIEEFRTLFERAVADRLRRSDAAVFMSGGLDSSSVAAVAKVVLAKKSPKFDLNAITVVYDDLIPDQERYYSGLVAKHLQFPIHYLVADRYELFENWDSPELSNTTEPINNPLAVISLESRKLASQHSRVALTGQGPDALLRFHMRRHVSTLLKMRNVSQLSKDLYLYLAAHRGLPYNNLLNRFRWWKTNGSDSYRYPNWLSKEFERSLGLRNRFSEINSRSSSHPQRPDAYYFLSSPFWTHLFEQEDFESTGMALQVRNPYFDLRLVKFLLGIPTIPWCFSKKLIREAMKGLLPERVRSRRKTPLNGTPRHPAKNSLDRELFEKYNSCPTANKYARLDAHEFASGGSRAIAYNVWIDHRPFVLASWLTNHEC